MPSNSREKWKPQRWCLTIPIISSIISPLYKPDTRSQRIQHTKSLNWGISISFSQCIISTPHSPLWDGPELFSCWVTCASFLETENWPPWAEKISWMKRFKVLKKYMKQSILWCQNCKWVMQILMGRWGSQASKSWGAYIVSIRWRNKQVPQSYQE